MTAPTVHLHLDPTVPTDRHAPIDHAFRTWAATRRLRVVGRAGDADLALTYGGATDDSLPATSWQPRDASARWTDGLPWLHAPGRTGGDHLAEIHAWVSARAELDGPTDPIGRRPATASTADRLDADRRIPWASRHLDAFDRVVGARRPALAAMLQRTGHRLTVLGSHDIDFLPTGRTSTLRRVARNLGVAAVGRRDPRLAAGLAGAAGTAALRRRPLLGGIDVVAELERRHDVRSTWTVLVAARHRRDAAYRATDPATRRVLDRLAAAGHEIGLHGSYESSTTPGALAEEADRLRRLGHDVVGSRQHWLRHDGVGLWGEAAKAGLRYDSSGGWPNEIGFRHGMAEPFVPFDLTTGAPATILEVPLVAMDVALAEVADRGDDPETAVTALLDEAARHGGAVSLLWHDTVFSDTQVRRGIASLYETLLARGGDWQPLAEAVSSRRPDWGAAGLPVGDPSAPT